uniref:Nodal modulator n=1 Tax=Latimeria chalumnae TaxID=7897 RepID=H3AWF4_LATCH
LLPQGIQPPQPSVRGVVVVVVVAEVGDVVLGSDDIVVGCGGFVKSEVEINYSLIEIKLYTKQGTLKYQTDCAPNNGYFMIPLYDKGDFILKIEPPLGWSFEPTSVDLHVDGINDICTKGEDINFVFTGFTVNGKVLSKGGSSGPAGVQVTLRKPKTGASILSTVTQPGGKYAFSKVLPGEYEIVATHPVWTLKHVSVHLKFSNLRKKSHLLQSLASTESLMGSISFAVVSCVGPSVSSPALRILMAILPIELRCPLTTKADGSFRLENMTAGTYTILAQKEHVVFDPITVKIAPNTPQLADIVATGFSVCGQIAVTRFPEGIKQANKYKVIMITQDKDRALSLTAETDFRGGFCFKAKPAAYSIKVVIPEAEVKAGLALKPTTYPVVVTDRPVMDVAFSQFMASISGKVTCLDSCSDLTVTLQPTNRQGEKQGFQLSGKANSIPFTFENILPGKYKVSIVHEEWCWKNKSLELEVLDDDVTGLEFRQTGYMLRCSLSHAITLEFYQDGSGPENVGVYNLSKGVNRFCLSKPGVYKVTPRSCHQFEQEYYTYDTAAPSILVLSAVRHHVLGAITTDKMMDVTVNIKSSIDSEPALVLGPLKCVQELRQEQQLAEIEARKQEREKKGQKEEGKEPPIQEMVEELKGPFSYEFAYWARAGEKIIVKPSSKELLFYPPSVETTISGENCPGKLIEIQGKAGLFLEGQIYPELEGVEIIISEKGAASPLITVFTGDKGSYSVGPLHRDPQYTISAQKEGFVLTPVEGTVGDFKAFALAGVSFEIRSEDGQPLPGVLLSLSGGQFRSNLLTQENGVLTFSNLWPGQYFSALYLFFVSDLNFLPCGNKIEKKIITEKTNIDITVPLYNATFFCYGTVSSLNGEPEQGVAMEAIGQKECSIYGEDTVTDEEGKFRLRGLLIIICYIYIKMYIDIHTHTPTFLKHAHVCRDFFPQVGNSDIDGVNFIAFRQINQFDLSGNVITSPEYLSTLWVKLYKSENLDNPIQTVSLGQSLFFHFPPLLRDGENFIVMLDSVLPKSQYDYTLPHVSFSATGYHKHVSLSFHPTRKLPDQDVAQGSYIALPLTLLLLLAGYNHDKLIPLLLQLTSRLQGVYALGHTGSDAGGPEDSRRQMRKQKAKRT